MHALLYMCNYFIYVIIRIYFVQCVMHEIYVVYDGKWIFTARHLQLESLPLTLKSFNLVFSFTVVDRVSREKFASAREYISVRT